MSMKVEIPVLSSISDDELQYIREIGVEHLAVTFRPEDTDYDSVMRLSERAAAHHLKIADGGCNQLFKNPAIHLGWDNKDEEIEKYNAFTRILGKADIHCGFIAWQPNGILRTGHAVGDHTRGGLAMIADMKEIDGRPILNDRVYEEEEIWENFGYFLKHALPVCEEADVKIALHPNDPPQCSLGGVHSLIYNTECYKKAFALAGNNPYLGMKMCIGCWLEAGEAFGNLMEDIKYFCDQKKILCVHFRNVSGTMPYFEETLAEDGYADMYGIMKQLVSCGYDQYINVDHAFKGQACMGGMLGSMGYATGYMKGLLAAAEQELGKK